MSITVIISVSSASSAVSSAISMTSMVGLATGGVFATILLIFLLSSQEIISASSYWNKKVQNSFNIFTIPLLLVFIAIVFMKISEVLK